jgi:3-oxoacyl-[acyl-carrier protein] reductase
MDMAIRNRKAIVNGGSAGLGFASALALAREGVELYISARSEHRLISACETIVAATGASVTPIVADHSSDEGRELILATCPEPDILVGASSPPRLVTDYRTITNEEMRSAIEIGLMSPFQFIQIVADGMATRRWGRIVNIASSAVKYPLELRTLSGAPRAALINYTVGISKKLAGHNVTVNTLLPALHLTEGTQALLEPLAATRGRSYEDEVQHQIETLGLPAGRFGNAEEFGAIVAMFCSEHASYITGQSLVIDGGLSNSIF